LFHQATDILDWALAIAFGFYLGIVASNSVLLRNGPDGGLWMAFVVLVSWAIDGAAYGAGRAWGRHKLWPQVSPGKTWEGAIGGWLAGVGASVIICWLIGVGWQHGLALGVWVATVSPFGDLTISMLKRQVGAKDSGNLIPGHGGALDRLDSMLFVVLLVRLYVTVFITG
jgi:phosphatidate cytidylyltransferase